MDHNIVCLSMMFTQFFLFDATREIQGLSIFSKSQEKVT